MMPNIVDGGNTVGLMQYLVGPGRRDEHMEPHIVAGSERIMRRWGDWSELSAAQANEIAQSIDQYMVETGTEAFGNIRTYDSVTDSKQVVGRGRNHVWHCSLSLKAEEGALSQGKWQRIAHDFMDEMGFTEASGKAPCRWVAVHHGQSKAGGDHIHIVANIVREDGTKWSSWQDQRRSQRACNVLEHKYGLEVVESRENTRGARHDSAQEQNAAKRQGKSLTDRAALETRVRAAATASHNEAEFVRRARQLGIRIRPRFASGRTDVVNGYSVALHSKPGQPTQWYGGNSLARDLSLTRLRTRWESTPHGSQEAVNEWRAAWRGERLRPQVHTFSSEEWDDHLRSLTEMQARFAAIDPRDPTALADATHDVAGILAAAAIRHDGTPQGRAYDRVARRLAVHGQTHHRVGAPALTPSALSLAAGLLMTATVPRGRAQDMALVMAALRLAQTLAALYRQAQQTHTARAIANDVTAVWAQINTPDPSLSPNAEYDALGTTPPPVQTDTLPEEPETNEDTGGTTPAALDPELEELRTRYERMGLLDWRKITSGTAPAPTTTQHPPRLFDPRQTRGPEL